jgi:glycosyltransferase involved in cell wall biosynthesis
MKKILYIDMIFPLTTGTFVYNEIKALNTQGFDVKTVSIASPKKEHVSSEAIGFYENTLYLDRVGFFTKIFFNLSLILRHPLKWGRLLIMALREREIRGFRDRLRILYHLFLAGYLSYKIKRSNFDHIHSPFLTGSATIALFLSLFLNIPFSFTMHASNIFVDPIMLGKKLKLCRRAVTISKFNKKYLIEKYGDYLNAKLHVIHCGIDVQYFKQHNSVKAKPSLIISVGQLTKRKGFSYLLKAAKLLKEREMEFKLVIVGDGEDAKDLYELAENLTILDVISFFGRQEQKKIKKLLGEATAFVLPSIVTNEGGREGIPVALMEAMSMKVPVISTRTVGIPELVDDRKNGLLVNEKDEYDLANAIEIFLNDEQLAIEMGRAGRIKVKQEFNLADTPNNFVKLFS